MNIMNKIRARAENNSAHEGVTIAFLGDSVTQGCFECYTLENNRIETVFDYSCILPDKDTGTCA